MKCEEIINLLLYKIGWFGGQLNELYHLYEKYVIDLIASSPTLASPLIQHLMRQILSSSLLGKRKQFDLDELRKQVSDIFENYKKRKLDEYILEGSDFDIAFNILQHHPRAKDKLAHISKICIMKNDNHASSTMSFYTISSEGKKEEISYVKCLTNMNSDAMNNILETLDNQYNAMHSNIVKMLSKIVCTFPLMAKYVISAVKNYFPYKSASLDQQYLYFRTTLDLASVKL